MSDAPLRLDIASAPFLHRGLSTRRLMLEVLLSLVPVVAAATWFFGLAAPLIVLASVLGATLTEWALRAKSAGLGSLRDGSAVLTGVLLALTLPPSIPLWMAFGGGVVAIGLGKAIWGGLGQNLFNPALVGRAFLQAAYPAALTTWVTPGRGFFSLPSSTIALPLAQGEVDVTTMATPLGMAKFEGRFTDWWPLFVGHEGGSLGETSAAVLLLAAVYLLLRRAFDWRLPISTLTSVAALSAVLHAVDPQRHPGPVFMLLSGGLMFAAVYMVTDPVTTPITPRGAWIFGVGVGAIVVLIRTWGGLPEGVMYAILLMNAATPLINRFTQPRRYGG